MKRVVLVSVLMCCWIISGMAQLVRPGMLHTREDLDRIKANVQSGREPIFVPSDILINVIKSSMDYCIIRLILIVLLFSLNGRRSDSEAVHSAKTVVNFNSISL